MCRRSAEETHRRGFSPLREFLLPGATTLSMTHLTSVACFLRLQYHKCRHIRSTIGMNNSATELSSQPHSLSTVTQFAAHAGRHCICGRKSFNFSFPHYTGCRRG